jgi:hypothetical protein
MIVATLILMTGTGQAMSIPTLTDADVEAVEACVDRGDNRGSCPGSGADNRTAIACMTELPEESSEDAFVACLSTVMERCTSSLAATTPEMNQRVLRICSARARGATQAAVADWFVRAERRLPANVYAGYQRTWGSVAPRADDRASSATANAELSLPLRVAAIRTGVWDSFALFLWRAERDED